MDLSVLYGASESAVDSIRTFTNGHIQTSSLQFNTTEDFITAIYGSDEILDIYDASNLNTFISNLGSINVPDINYNSNENQLSNITQCPLFSYASISSGLPNVTPLAALQTLFALNHNRIADELASEHGSWDDEKLFYEARQFNIATFQHITYNEYIPILLAQNYNNQELTYEEDTDATTSTMFCTIGMRYGHGVMPNNFAFGGYRDGNTWGTPNFGQKVDNIVAEIAFRDTYTRPCIGIQEIGNDDYLGSILSGMMLSTENVISPKYCEEIRSFLSIAALKTTDNDIKNWDLLAADIQRYNNIWKCLFEIFLLCVLTSPFFSLYVVSFFFVLESPLRVVVLLFFFCCCVTIVFVVLFFFVMQIS